MQQNRFRQIVSRPALRCLAAAAVLGCAGAAHATVVFQDTFANSSLNGTSSPSITGGGSVVNTTSYDIASAKDGTGSAISSGDLKVAMSATTGGIINTQARFASSPVSLNTGDSIEMTVVFTDNGGILSSGSSTSAQLDFGMYNSAGSAPATGLNNAGLSSSQTGSASGGVQNWQGYNAQIFFTGGNSKLSNRPQQTGADNTNQDLLTNNASSSQSFHSPAGSGIGSSSSTPSQTLNTTGPDNIYAEDLVFTNTGGSALQIASNLYSGSGISGTPISTLSATTSATNFLTSSFDGLGIGWRTAIPSGGTSQASQMDISSITVSVNSVPEPASLSLLALGGIALVRRRRA